MTHPINLPEEAFRAAADACRALAADYRRLGLPDRADGAMTCANLMDLRARLVPTRGRTKPDPQSRIAELKAQWEHVCSGMNRGGWRGTEADALARIASIKAEIAELEAAI